MLGSILSYDIKTTLKSCCCCFLRENLKILPHIHTVVMDPITCFFCSGFIQGSLSKIQGLFKYFSRPFYSLQGQKI